MAGFEISDDLVKYAIFGILALVGLLIFAFASDTIVKYIFILAGDGVILYSLKLLNNSDYVKSAIVIIVGFGLIAVPFIPGVGLSFARGPLAGYDYINVAPVDSVVEVPRGDIQINMALTQQAIKADEAGYVAYAVYSGSEKVQSGISKISNKQDYAVDVTLQDGINEFDVKIGLLSLADNDNFRRDLKKSCDGSVYDSGFGSQIDVLLLQKMSCDYLVAELGQGSKLVSISDWRDYPDSRDPFADVSWTSVMSEKVEIVYSTDLDVVEPDNDVIVQPDNSEIGFFEKIKNWFARINLTW